jgi:hypothetical protein
MIELDDTYIGGKKKSGERNRESRSEVPITVAMESQAKGSSHVIVRDSAPLSTPTTENQSVMLRQRGS